MIRLYRYFASRIAFRYVVSGSTAAALNLVIFAIGERVTSANPIYISIVASCIAFWASFLMQKYFTFQHNTPITLYQLTSFLLIFLVNLGLTTLLFWLFLQVVPIGFVDQFLAIGSVATASFFLYRSVVFRTAADVIPAHTTPRRLYAKISPMSETADTHVTNTQVEPVHADDRGSIFDIVEDTVSHVGMVTFSEGSIRGNHYHKISTQYSYVLKGELELTTSHIDGSDKKVDRLVPGTLTKIPPHVVHAYKAITEAEMLDIVTLSRNDDGYETDTVRVKIV